MSCLRKQNRVREALKKLSLFPARGAEWNRSFPLDLKLSFRFKKYCRFRSSPFIGFYIFHFHYQNYRGRQAFFRQIGQGAVRPANQTVAVPHRGGSNFSLQGHFPLPAACGVLTQCPPLVGAYPNRMGRYTRESNPGIASIARKENGPPIPSAPACCTAAGDVLHTKATPVRAQTSGVLSAWGLIAKPSPIIFSDPPTSPLFHSGHGSAIHRNRPRLQGDFAQYVSFG